MPYLIDGYNLLFAYLGSPPSRKLSKALERGRRRLLDIINRGRGALPEDVTVVFDAAHAPPGAPAEFRYHDIHVAFAVQNERADDLIEDLIRRASAPRKLTVVTDDHHIQQAARRRHCTVRACADFLDALEHGSKTRPLPQSDVPAKPQEAPSREETQRWLTEFADLERDPAMRELSDPYGCRSIDALPDR